MPHLQLPPAIPQFEPSVMLAAQAYVQAGFSVIPLSTDGQKRPDGRLLPVIGTHPNGRPHYSWSPYRERFPTHEELYEWYGWRMSTPGIGVVCGAISGGLEAIDVDSDDHAVQWIERLVNRAPSLLNKLVFSQTPRPGMHVYYRCASPGRNSKWARVFTTNERGASAPCRAIIETRGEGGYITVPPTPGHCHSTGRPYIYLNDRTLLDVPTINLDERYTLVCISRSFNELPAAPRRITMVSRREVRPSNGNRPGDLYNAQACWADLLGRHGWSLSMADELGCQHWRRPGKDSGTSATVNHEGNDLLYVFTSNAAPLEPETAYTKFHFLTLLEHDGDFLAAAAALMAQGYGQQQLVLPNQPRRTRQASRRRRGRRR